VWKLLPVENFSGDLASFSCGSSADEKNLNNFLELDARRCHTEGLCSVYILTNESSSSGVVGYFTLSNSTIPHKELPDLFSKDFSYDIPCVLVGKFALDKTYQGKKWKIPKLAKSL